MSVLAVCGLYACESDACIEGEGNIVTISPTVEPFTSVENRGAVDLTIELGFPSVNIVGHENASNGVNVQVKDNRLVIDTDFACLENATLNVKVTSFNLTRLINSGSGNLTVESVRGNGALTLENMGAGNLHFYDLGNTESLMVTHAGSGNITGHDGQLINDLSLTMQGSGNFSSDRYPTRTVHLISSGSGDASLWATIKADISIAGSGNVILKGESDLYEEISGSGKLQRVF